MIFGRRPSSRLLYEVATQSLPDDIAHWLSLHRHFSCRPRAARVLELDEGASMMRSNRILTSEQERWLGCCAARKDLVVLDEESGVGRPTGHMKDFLPSGMFKHYSMNVLVE